MTRLLHRPLRLRLAAPHVLMVTSGLLAFVLVYVISSDQVQTVPIAVAAHDLQPGQEVDAASIERLDVPASLGERIGLPPGDLLQFEEPLTVARTVSRGMPIRSVDVADRSPSSSRLLALPLELPVSFAEWIAPGDRVDLVSVVDGEAVFVATSVLIAAIDAGSGIGRRDMSLTLAVEPGQELAIVAASDRGGLHVVREARD